MRNLAFASILLFAVSISAATQDSKHSFTVADAATLHRAAPVAVSPDGKSILYRVQFGAQKGPDKTEWHMISTTGNDSRPLNIPDAFHPAGFTRDGSALYGTFAVNKMPQLATLAIPPANTPAAAAATPVPMTGLPKGIHSAHISPDGSHYAILADPRLPEHYYIGAYTGPCLDRSRRWRSTRRSHAEARRQRSAVIRRRQRQCLRHRCPRRQV